MNYRLDLQNKINHSISLIREWEEIALNLHDYGYLVGFSGGKDSQAVLHLVELAQVKYKAVYNNTTNDDPENIRFIRKYYPNVQISNPPKNFFTLIEEQGLPTMTTRYCCKILKEYSSNGTVSITGVRKEESRKRSTYAEVEIRSKRKPYEDKQHILLIKENFIENTSKKIRKNDNLKVQPPFRMD